MKIAPTLWLIRRQAGILGFLSILVFCGGGCQTFTMSQEEFQRAQLRRYDANPDTDALLYLGGPVIQGLGEWLASR